MKFHIEKYTKCIDDKLTVGSTTQDYSFFSFTFIYSTLFVVQRL